MKYRPKVLLVDEDPQSIPFLEPVPEKTTVKFFHFIHSGTLKDAIRRLENETVDIILLDLSLPDSDGLNTLRALTQLQLDIPIVVYSRRQNEKLALETTLEGADSFLCKTGIDEHSLVRALRLAYERHRLKNELKRSIDELFNVRLGKV